MHEAGICESMVEAALRACNGRVLTALWVEVGALSSANAEALRFWMELVLQQRGLSGVAVHITAVPALLHCRCGTRYATADLFTGCPACGGCDRQVLAGMDVTLKYAEVEDDDKD